MREKQTSAVKKRAIFKETIAENFPNWKKTGIFRVKKSPKD